MQWHLRQAFDVSGINPPPPAEVALDHAHRVTASPSGLDDKNHVHALARAHTAALAKLFGEASGICDDVLKATPDHPEALALLGIISSWAGEPERGVVLLKRAIELRPGHATWAGN